jgi:hypothetical protein
MRTVNRANIPAAAAFSLVCILTAMTAVAQITGPCEETVSRFCKDVTPGSGRIMRCLNEHRDDQSMPCRDWLADQNKSLKDLNEACSKEIAQLCSIDPPDGLRIYLCLEANYVALRSDCRAKLREIKDRMQ